MIIFYFLLLNRLVYVDTCLSTIKLKAEDASGRKHVITLKLKPKVCASFNCYGQEILCEMNSECFQCKEVLVASKKKKIGTLKTLFWKAHKTYPSGFQKPRHNVVSLF